MRQRLSLNEKLWRGLGHYVLLKSNYINKKPKLLLLDMLIKIKGYLQNKLKK